MSKLTGTRTDRHREHKTNGRETTRPQQPALPGSQADVLALQQAAGNRAVTSMVHSTDGRESSGAAAPPVVQRVLSIDGGQPLDSLTRTEMESRFGEDLSAVRLHTGHQAAESAAAVGARAYTVGRDIVFGAGRLEPGTSAGQQLLGHELAHVVQQRRGGAGPPLRPDAPHEQDAERAAAATGAGHGPVSVASATAPGLARDDDPELDQLLDEALKEEKRPGKPVKPTKPGQPANVGAQKALTPQELLDEHVFGSHVEEEIGDLRKRLKAQEAKLTQNPKDLKLQKRVAAMRQQLRVLEGKGLDPKQTGTNVPGHGRINTRAAVQLVGPDGNIIAVERGRWHPDRHAEEDAIQKLRKRLGSGKLPPGTRINVAGNQYVCSDVCKPAVRQFAQDYGVDPSHVDATVRTRPKVSGTGEASPKTTERTGLRSDVPKGKVKTEPLFPKKAPQPASSTKPPVAQPKTPPARVTKPATPAPKAVKPKVPAAVAPSTGKIRLPSGGRLRSMGRGAAGAIATLVLQYFIGKWMAKVEQDLVNQQIEKKQPEIEAKLQKALEAQSEELIKLREANPDADIYINIVFELHRYNVATEGGIMQTLPVVEIGRIGYSLEPWGPTPTRLDTVACIQTVEVESLTVSDKVPIKELFEE